MAGSLVKYGYGTKTAMPLIQAVEIYNRLGVAAETEAVPVKFNGLLPNIKSPAL